MVHLKALLSNYLKATWLKPLLLAYALKAITKQKKQKNKPNYERPMTMTHEEQANKSKQTLTFCIKDLCNKSDMSLGSAKVGKEGLVHNLSSLMGILQVHTEMNLIHEELKAMCTMELAHEMFTIVA